MVVSILLPYIINHHFWFNVKNEHLGISKKAKSLNFGIMFNIIQNIKTEREQYLLLRIELVTRREQLLKNMIFLLGIISNYCDGQRTMILMHLRSRQIRVENILLKEKFLRLLFHKKEKCLYKRC